MHTYIHTYIHAYTHTYMHTHIHTYMHACMHTYIHTYMHTYIHTHKTSNIQAGPDDGLAAVQQSLLQHSLNSDEIISNGMYEILYDSLQGTRCEDEGSPTSARLNCRLAQTRGNHARPRVSEADDVFSPSTSRNTTPNEESDDEPDLFDDDSSESCSSQRKYISWKTVDSLAPKLSSNEDINRIMHSCHLVRVPKGCNGRASVYKCGYCSGFWRKVCKNTLTVYMPGEEALMHHKANCMRASAPYVQDYNIAFPGYKYSLQARQFILLSRASGGKPKAIEAAIKTGRATDSTIATLFPEPINVKTIRNICSYENLQRRHAGLTGPEYMVGRNIGLQAWCDRNSIEQPGFQTVKSMLHSIAMAADNQKRMEMIDGLRRDIPNTSENEVLRDLIDSLRRDEKSRDIFVVDKCTDASNKVKGFAFCNALVCLNLVQAILTLGVDGINICVDGTYNLCRLGWVLINWGTHSIEAHEDGVLAQKFRPLIYVFGESESKDMASLADRAIKSLARSLGHTIHSFAVVAFDHCEAFMQTLTHLNPLARPVTDWTHVIMNCKRSFVELFNVQASETCLRLYRAAKATTTPRDDTEYEQGLDLGDQCAPLCEISADRQVDIKAVVCNWMLDHVRLIHVGRTLDMCVYLGSLITKLWEDEYLQPMAAKWFRDTYLVPQWLCWHVSASGMPGTIPSTQMLESFHKHIKHTDTVCVKYVIEDLLGHVLKHILGNHGTYFVGNTINRSRPITPTDFALRATLMVQHNGDSHANFLSVHDNDGEPSMYFNVRVVTSTKALLLHENVSMERIKLYESGLQGEFSDVQCLAAFRSQHMSLWKVFHNPRTRRYECQCKDFWRVLVCSHLLVYEYVILGSTELSTALEPVRAVRVSRSAKIQVNHRQQVNAQGKVAKSRGITKVTGLSPYIKHRFHDTHTYTHTYSHATIQTDIFTSLHTYMHTYIHTYIHT